MGSERIEERSPVGGIVSWVDVEREEDGRGTGHEGGGEESNEESQR